MQSPPARPFPEWGLCTSKCCARSLQRCLSEENRGNALGSITLTLGAVDTPSGVRITVHASFEHPWPCLPQIKAAEALLFYAQQPSSQVVEDLTLIPATARSNFSMTSTLPTNPFPLAKKPEWDLPP